MESKIIGVDADDLLFDFIGGIIKYHNKEFGTNLDRKDFTSYSFHEIWGGTGKEAVEKVFNFHKEGGYRRLVPLEGSIEGIKILKQRGHNLHVITSRPEFMKEDTEESINNFYKNQFSGIHFSKNHYSNRINNRFKTKAEICSDLGASLLIEDSLEYAKQCMQKGIKTILLDAPWNQTNGKDLKNISRVENWNDILEKLK